MKYFLAVAMILTGFFGTVYAVPEPFSTEEVFDFEGAKRHWEKNMDDILKINF